MYHKMSDDLIAGGLGGVVKTLIAQPFDTLKVRKQCSNRSPIGFKGLYKGIAFPMLSNTIFQGVSLSLQRQINDRIDNHGLAGAVTGAICCVFTCPLDSWKVARQNRSRVLLRNAYRGFFSSMLRESVASGAFFVSYGNLLRMTNNTTVAGGLGGLTATLVSLPIDTIKTRLQSGQSMHQAVSKGSYNAGMQYVVIKAILTNAACYFVYGHVREMLIRAKNKKDGKEKAT